VAETIRAFFENDYIKWRTIDRAIADVAQSLCQTYAVHPRDALHLAVAMEERCDLLETTDPRLLRLDGQQGIGVAIQPPKWVGQPKLFDTDK
jgi:predicted nucleic acid-binding protein